MLSACARFDDANFFYGSIESPVMCAVSSSSSQSLYLSNTLTYIQWCLTHLSTCSKQWNNMATTMIYRPCWSRPLLGGWGAPRPHAVSPICRHSWLFFFFFIIPNGNTGATILPWTGCVKGNLALIRNFSFEAIWCWEWNILTRAIVSYAHLSHFQVTILSYCFLELIILRKM